MRFVIPKDSLNIKSDGLKKSGYLGYVPKTYIDNVFNNLVSDNVIRFDHRRFSLNDPIKTYDLNISYTLPERLNFNKYNEYKLLIQKHPGKSWEIYKININYNNLDYSTEFILDRDKEVIFDGQKIVVNNYNTNLDWILKFIKNFE